MNWKAFIYPLFRGYPRVIVVDRAHFRYEERERFVSFMGEAVRNGFVISTDSICEWHLKGGTQPLSEEERRIVQERIQREFRSLGYTVVFG